MSFWSMFSPTDDAQSEGEVQSSVMNGLMAIVALAGFALIFGGKLLSGAGSWLSNLGKPNPYQHQDTPVSPHSQPAPPIPGATAPSATRSSYTVPDVSVEPPPVTPVLPKTPAQHRA